MVTAARLLRRLLVWWVSSTLLAPLAGPAWAADNVPEPTYLVRNNTLNIYPRSLTAPELAKGVIEGAHAQSPWYYHALDGSVSTYYCTADVPTFSTSDFLTAQPPFFTSRPTIAKAIQRNVGGCGGWTQIPNGLYYCSSPACVPDTSGHWYEMMAECPQPWAFFGGTKPRCDCQPPWELRKQSDGSWGCSLPCTGNLLDRSDCHRSDQSCKVGNPIQPGTATKVQTETDYEGAGAHALSFVRTFRSFGMPAYVSPGGWSHWVHNWGSRVDVHPVASRPGRAWVLRGDATQREYTSTGNGTWTAWQVGDRNRLMEDRDAAGTRKGFRYLVWADNSVEHYDLEGRLLKVVQRNGWTNTLTYSTSATPASVAPRPDLLLSVRNHFGRELRFTYDGAGRLSEVLPPGAISGSAAGSATSPIRYGHAEPASLGPGVASANQPTSVTWQDGHVRRYHYEHAPSPGLLSGITDELGVRIGTYVYNATGRVTRTMGPNGTNVIDLVHSGTSSQVIDRSGPTPVTSTYTWQQVQGVIRPVAVSAPCPLCGTSQASTAYTATGEVARSVGHDGRITFFSYDSKGRETVRAVYPAAYHTATVRPALSVAEEVVTTQWHATWQLPLQRAEAGFIQWWTYDSKGNRLTHRRQLTVDATGAAGLAAARTGSVSGRNLSYTTKGLLATATDVIDATTTASWTYSYNASGDLTRITGTDSMTTSTADLVNEAGGRVAQVAASNGALASFSYTARGALLAAQSSSVAMSLTRDARGLPIRMDTSGGGWLRIDYDPAGHPSQVTDFAGETRSLAMGLAKEHRAALKPQSEPSFDARRWLAWVPLPTTLAQPVPPTVLMPSLVGTGLLVLPWSQVRPLDPTDPGLCCLDAMRPSPYQFQRGFDGKVVSPPALLLITSASILADQVFDDILTLASAYRLRRNMERCGNLYKTRTWCCDTHHIVPRRGYNRGAVAESQMILSEAGMTIDDWENGVYLDCANHRGVHGPTYENDVLIMLRSIPPAARNRTRVGAALQAYGQTLKLKGGC